MFYFNACLPTTSPFFKSAGKVFHDAIIHYSSSKCTSRLRAQSLGYSPRPSMMLLAKIAHCPWRPTTTRSLYNGPHNPSFRARNAIGTERRPRREDPPPPPTPGAVRIDSAEGGVRQPSLGGGGGGGGLNGRMSPTAGRPVCGPFSSSCGTRTPTSTAGVYSPACAGGHWPPVRHRRRHRNRRRRRRRRRNRHAAAAVESNALLLPPPPPPPPPPTVSLCRQHGRERARRRPAHAAGVRREARDDAPPPPPPPPPQY